jgi:arsenate reductase
VSVDAWRVYRIEDAREVLTNAGIDVATAAAQADGKFASAFIRAAKPAAKGCGGPTCCNQRAAIDVTHVKTYLFACVHNAGRSQMAAAFFNALADPSKARAVSAGTAPAVRVHPDVIDAMQEVGLDLSAARPQKLTDSLAQAASVLVTMGCGDKCPFVAGTRIEDWPLPDPNGADVETVRRIRDEIRDRVTRLIETERLARD